MQLSTPLGKDVLLINRLRCREGLNQLFHIELDMLHEQTDEGFAPHVIEPGSVLGKRMVVVAQQAQTSEKPVERYFHGICIGFTQGSRNGRFTGFQAELVPQAWLLTQVRQCRIFQNQPVPEILNEVLRGTAVKFELTGRYEARNYCTQYNETDWDFASRLMEEEGIFYYFEHTAKDHYMIIADTPASHRPCPTQPKITFALERSDLADDWIPSIRSWRVDSRLRTGRFELSDFNFQLPNHRLEAEHTSLYDLSPNRQLPRYEWSGGYAKRFDGIDPGGGERPGDLAKVFEDRERTVRIRQEEIDVAYKNVYGTADSCALTAGHKFEFTDHPVKKFNIEHVVVLADHDAHQSPMYDAERSVPGAYSVNFACIPHGAGQAPFRPMRKTPKPVISGGQTAFVVGDPGQEIFTDKFGRAKVQFHWDRQGRMDSRSSCWLRVAHSWAGSGWGSMFVPRVGMEVLVHFLEGDPDQPIITGCVYNPANMPPYKLPDHKTRSGIKTASTTGGGGFNELRFEDKKGQEQIFIHAEKDHDIRVTNECKETIGADRHMVVGGDQLEKVHGDKHLRVAGDRYERVEGDNSLIVTGDYDMRSTATNLEAKVIHLKALNVMVEGGDSLTLKSGACFITLKKDGSVYIKGHKVMINSGGSHVTPADCAPKNPLLPKLADSADAVRRVEQADPPQQRSPIRLTAIAVNARKVRKQKDAANNYDADAAADRAFDKMLSAAERADQKAEAAADRAFDKALEAAERADRDAELAAGESLKKFEEAVAKAADDDNETRRLAQEKYAEAVRQAYGTNEDIEAQDAKAAKADKEYVRELTASEEAKKKAINDAGEQAAQEAEAIQAAKEKAVEAAADDMAEAGEEIVKEKEQAIEKAVEDMGADAEAIESILSAAENGSPFV